MTKPQDSIMSKIMKLLERANHPSTPEAEAKACEEKADALMAQHQIDRMDLKPEEKAKIIQDAWSIHFGVSGKAHEFGSAIESLMRAVLSHCKIKMDPRYSYGTNENGDKDYGVRVFKLVGFPEDIAYAERIWFRVFKEFVFNVNPGWRKDASIEDNAYDLVKASIDWQTMVLMANNAGDDRIPVSELEVLQPYDKRQIPVKGNRPLIKGINMLRDAYRAECERRGEAYEYNKGDKTRASYRSSFAISFAGTIKRRLDEMRQKAEETVSDRDKYALALVDTEEQVEREFYRLFPEFDPEIRKRQRDAAAAEAVADFLAMSEDEQAYVIDYVSKEEAENEKRWQRAAGRARRNYGTIRGRDYGDVQDRAWKAGHQAASSVNLRDDAEVKRETRKGIR